MNKTKNSVIVELYDLTLTERKDDRFGRVVTTKSLNEEDLITKAVARRTDLNATTLRASFELLQKIALEEIANGASVKFGLVYLNLGVRGVFYGDNAKWDTSQHSLQVKATPTSFLRETVDSSVVEVRGMAAVGIAINTVTDLSTGELNGRITLGGGVNVTGSRIKIDGTEPGVGISFINQTTNEVTMVPKTSILVNEPSKISFIVPATLQAGDYKMSICSQYSSSNKFNKEARTSVFDNVLTVS